MIELMEYETADSAVQRNEDKDMKVFTLPRGSGKTMRMLYASEFNNIPILCVGEATKNCLIEQAKQFNLNIPEPVTVREIDTLKSKRIDKILIDELAAVMQSIFNTYGLNIVGCTISTGETNNGT